MMFCPDAYLGAGGCSEAGMCCMQTETMQECCTLCSTAAGLHTHSAGPPLKRGLCWPAMAHQSQNTWFLQPDERCLVSQPLALQVADAAACCLCQKPAVSGVDLASSASSLAPIISYSPTDSCISQTVRTPGGSRCRPHPCSGQRSWRRPGWTCQSGTDHRSTCKAEQAVAEQDLSTLRMCLDPVCWRDALCMVYRHGGSRMPPHMLRISNTCNEPLTAVRALHLQMHLPC